MKRSKAEVSQILLTLQDVAPEVPLPKGDFYRGMRASPATINAVIDSMVMEGVLYVDRAGHFFRFGQKGKTRKPKPNVFLAEYPSWVTSIVEEWLSQMTDVDRAYVSKRTYRAWCHALWLCHEIDEMSPELIAEVVWWAKNHPWWGKNCFTSLSKLRKHSMNDETMYVHRWRRQMELDRVKENDRYAIEAQVKTLLGK